MHYIHRQMLVIAVVFSWSLALDIAVSAEYYQYKDQNGVVHFTDDFSEVPKNQREKATSFESLTSDDSRPSVLLNEENKNSWDDQSEEKQTSDEGETIDDKLLETSISLQEERAELEQTFENLQEKRAELAAKAMKKRTSEETKVYKKQVQQLNIDIKKYEDRQKQFTEKVEIYNNNVKQRNLSKAQAD